MCTTRAAGHNPQIRSAQERRNKITPMAILNFRMRILYLVTWPTYFILFCRGAHLLTRNRRAKDAIKESIIAIFVVQNHVIGGTIFFGTV